MKKQINGYSNYFIYDNGDLYNSDTQKLLKGKVRAHGYRCYTLSKNNVKTDYYAHRLVAEYFIPNPNNLPIVNHKDGNKLNNNVDNLEWVTASENTKHAHDTGLIKQRRETEYYEGNLDGEEWIDVPGYSNYLVSSKGRVMNQKTNRILKPSIVCGYQKVRLSEDGNIKDFLVHYLVYTLFTKDEVDTSKFIIDHIDGNKINNELSNLRKMSQSENTKAAYYEQGLNKSCKVVQQYSLEGKLLNTFPSAAEAARQLHLDGSTISKVCRGQNKTHGGFIFKYV